MEGRSTNISWNYSLGHFLLSIIDCNGQTYFLHQLSEPLATEHKAENITGYPSKCPSPIFKLLRILRGCQPRLQSTDEKFWWFLPLKSWSPKKEPSWNSAASWYLLLYFCTRLFLITGQKLVLLSSLSFWQLIQKRPRTKLHWLERRGLSAQLR